MFNRVKNVFNAIIGYDVTCNNCNCHNKNSIDLSDMDPDVADMLRTLAKPEKHEELLAEMAAQGANKNTPTPAVCQHLDFVPTCHYTNEDTKPDWCSSSKCPVRAYTVALTELQKKAAMVAYG